MSFRILESCFGTHRAGLRVDQIVERQAHRRPVRADWREALRDVHLHVEARALKARSGRADGLRILVDGEPAATEVVRDHLTKDITGSGGDTIALGERFRDRGFTGGRNWNETPAFLTREGDRWRVEATLPEGATAWFVNARAGSLTASSDFQQVP